MSFADDDDREMRAPDIASALRRGEIRGDTIVWREGLPEWVALSSVPLLAKLLVNTGETRTAPVAVAKIPLVQREQTAQAKPTNSATATPIGLASPSARTPLAGANATAPTPAPSTSDATPPPSSTGETPAATPAWKGRTRIGIPRMDTGTPGATTEAAEKPAPRSAVGTPLPTSAKPAPQVKSGAAASPTTTPLATSVAKQTPDSTKQETGATPGKLSPVEPKRPEPWTLEPKLGAKPQGTPRPGSVAPRTVPKAAPAPSVKITDGTPASPKTTDTPSPSAEVTTAPAPAAAPASSPKAAEHPAAAVPASSPKAAEAPMAATAAESSSAAAVPPSPTPPSAAVSPVESKAAASPAPPAAAPASPEPPKAAEGKAEPLRRKPEPPKGPPPPRGRDVARAPAAKRDAAPASARRGSANIWEDDEAVSVDPESVRPPPPVHAIAEARATGPLGVKKKAPKPPSPKLKPRPEPAAEPADADNSIPIPMPDFEGDVNLANIVADAAAAPVAQLSLPLVTEFAETPATPMVDTTPTVPRDVKDSAASKAAVVSTAPSSAPPPEKRRSLFPLVLIGAAAGVCLMFALKRQAPSEPVPAAPEPPRTAEPTQPTNAVVTPTPPAEPEPTAAASAEAPAPPASGAAAPVAKPASPGTTKPSGATTQVVSSGESTAAPKEPKPQATAAATTEGKKPAPLPEQPQVDDVGGEFDKAAASAALGSAAATAAGCRKEGDPTGVAVVHVTFSNAGRATRATVEGPPFAGTATGGCIAETLRKVKIPPYGGDRVTVTKRVVIQ